MYQLEVPFIPKNKPSDVQMTSRLHVEEKKILFKENYSPKKFVMQNLPTLKDVGYFFFSYQTWL